jgi:hypothetical protein
VRRDLIAALAIAGALASGYDIVNRRDVETDEERTKERRERIAKANRERNRREIPHIESYDKGIDPTNGRKLSRQQRRQIERKGIPTK